MANIFKEQKAVNEHPNRNNFDLSKKSNLSMKFGTLYPVYCQPVVPGDSFSIDTAFNLKLQPVIFPVQTKMRAHMHYFYVRNKNLWSNWENWISNLVSQSDHPHPYVDLPDYKFTNGSIHDFLGVPTSCVTDQSYDITSSLTASIGRPLSQLLYVQAYSSSFDDKTVGYLSENNLISWSYDVSTTKFGLVGILLDKKFVGNKIYFLSDYFKDFLALSVSKAVYLFSSQNAFSQLSSDDVLSAHWGLDDNPFSIDLDDNSITLNDSVIDKINDFVSSGKFVKICFWFGVSTEISSSVWDPSAFKYVAYTPGFTEYKDLNIPLYSEHLHINALPYRAYESIYYCYYNNNVLNPLMVNNQIQYNRYNTELGDGADTTDYHLFQRNYELDFLTSALPSPQQGVAPVVGMTALGDITIEDENGITTAHATIDDDGTISKVVLTSPAASNEHARTAMNIASCGMSISDFRQTNALQRFLETNIRKGYRYMDFIAGHFGMEPEYRELDLPEFIGGFSRDVSVSTVVSNADTLGLDDSGAALGQYGGYAQVVGGSNHSVRHYCDDYGYIIGILSVVPTPCYSQLLPKHMIAPDNFLDYYFPEFSSSGLQPITYKEVAPIQSYLDSLTDSDKRLEDTFGYQRPNYDLVSAVDEIHGDFRGSLKDYVINRIFDTRPELGQSFISINPSEINDIFVDNNPDDDTILGEIGFSVHAKRPIPRVVIPNLGK